MNLNCQDPSNEDYCVLIGHNRDKLPPNPPLNISMTLAISVRICEIPSIRDWVLRKRGLDGDNSCLKFMIFFSKYQKKNLTLFYATF